MADLNDEFNDGEIDDDDEDLREEFDDDDRPDNEEEENGMMSEGVVNTLKQVEVIKDEDDEAEDDEAEQTTVKKSRKKTKFVSNFPKFSENEYIAVLTELATLISESRIFVPREHETLLDCECGNSITIARNWIKHRKIVPIPCILLRSAPNRIPEKVKLDNLPLKSELAFNDFGW